MVTNSLCKDGYQNVCKSCKANQWKQAAGKSPEKYATTRLKRIYGISIDQWNQLFIKQNGCCAICTRHQSEFKKKLFVDHDHQTGEVRGLLCHKCNVAIGLLQDDMEIINKASTYLNRSKIKAV